MENTQHSLGRTTEKRGVVPSSPEMVFVLPTSSSLFSTGCTKTSRPMSLISGYGIEFSGYQQP